MSEGQTHILSVHEGAPTEDEVVGGEPQVRRRYLVKKDIFKRGRLWEVGEEIELDPETGQRFVDLDEIEELES